VLWHGNYITTLLILDPAHLIYCWGRLPQTTLSHSITAGA